MFRPSILQSIGRACKKRKILSLALVSSLALVAIMQIAPISRFLPLPLTPAPPLTQSPPLTPSSPAGLAGASVTHGTVVLGTNYDYYSTAYGTHIFWTQTLYSDSLNYFPDHLNFTNAELGSSGVYWTFGLGVQGDNLSISQIASNLIELDDSGIPASTVNIYFYYAGASPTQVDSIYASGFMQSYSAFLSCAAPCVFLNQSSSYVEISNPAGSAMQNFVYLTPIATTVTTSSATSSSSTISSGSTFTNSSSTQSISNSTSNSSSSQSIQRTTSTQNSSTPSSALGPILPLSPIVDAVLAYMIVLIAGTPFVLRVASKRVRTNSGSHHWRW